MKLGFIRGVTVAAVLALAATSAVSIPVSAQSVSAQVRVIHASPDAPAVDIYVDATRALAGVPYKAVSSYLNVPAGDRRVQVRPAGADPSSAAVIDAIVTPQGGRSYTVMATGALANIAPVVIADDLTAPAPGKGKVRVIHASPDAPAVDIAVKNGPVLVSNLSFRSATPYLQLDPGTYDLEIRPAGTTTVAVPLPGVHVEAGKVVSAIAVGFLGGRTPSFEVMLVSDASFSNTANVTPTELTRRIYEFLYGAR